VRTYPSPDACLSHALDSISTPGTALEFGVCDGHSLRRIVAGMPAGSRVVGFDSFQGLPEHWRDGFGIGTFRTTAPVVPGAELVVGLFDETLPAWAVPENVVLVHIDCDLYSSTRAVLEHVGPRLQPGALIVFDEFHGYPDADAHEARAWSEWAAAAEVAWTELATGPEQLLVRIEEAS